MYFIASNYSVYRLKKDSKYKCLSFTLGQIPFFQSKSGFPLKRGGGSDFQGKNSLESAEKSW